MNGYRVFKSTWVLLFNSTAIFKAIHYPSVTTAQIDKHQRCVCLHVLPKRLCRKRHKNIKTYSLQVVYFSSSARRDRGLLRLSECRAMLAWAMPSVSNLVDRQLSPCDGGVLVHTLIICLYVLKNILSSSNPLGFQPLPLYFLAENTWGEKVTMHVVSIAR